MKKSKYRKKVEQGAAKIGLKTRLTLYVTAEMLFCVVIGYALDELLLFLLGDRWKVPFVVELIALCLLVGILITWVLSKQFFDPVKKLRKAMEKVATGDYSVQLTDKTSFREIQEVYTGFNVMTRELGSTEMLQNDFVSVVSHEFKTPLAAIGGYATLLQGGENLSPTQQAYVEKINFNTKRLSDLASNILMLSKLENQSISTNKKNFDLDEQIRQSVLAYEDAWAEKNLEFDVELDDVTYYGNEGLMHHVWDNLISNAIKFSPENGTIRIALKTQKNAVRFTIEDEGPGIGEAAQRHIFDKFYQEDTSHKAEGHGLGLAMVKRIVDLSDGKVTVENRKEGGCRFTVTLKHKK